MIDIFDFMIQYNYINAATRGTGRTTALIEAAKKIDGIFITATSPPPREVESIHYTSKQLYGTTKPIILDHYVLDILFKRFREIHSGLNKVIYELSNEIRGLKLLIDFKERGIKLMQFISKNKWRKIKKKIKKMRSEGVWSI